MILSKRILLIVIALISISSFAQGKGEITGKILDKDMNNEPLPFSNVFIKNSQTGTTSDFDGNYRFQATPGVYTLTYSFIGYETIEIPNIVVIKNETTVIPEVVLGTSEGVVLDEIIIQGNTRKESESSLLATQKKATVIKESIGSDRLNKLGVSNAAAATAKISGVTKNEATGDIYIRGLGDRYLSTTMNKLPIPSDDVEKKNIDLNLFSTNVIQNVGISKTYTTSGYGDQVSGNVDVTSKRYSGDKYSVGVQFGSNTNVMKSDVWNDFKASQNINDMTLGFYTKKQALVDAITHQSWNTATKQVPLDFKFDFSGGRKFDLFGKDLSVFLTASHGAKHTYEEGVFKTYRSNVLDNSFTDATNYTTNINTTALIDLRYQLNSNNKISYNTLFVNKSIDNVYESGRNGEGYVFDQDPQEEGAFIRDQNLKQTRMFVNQLIGSHTISETNKLEWAAGYNYVWAEEPNRIRNEVNILGKNTVQFAHVGDFQQRKSSQKIVDDEINAYVNDQIIFNEEAEYPLKLNIGANVRMKERDFNSQMIGVRAKGVQTVSIDDLNAVFTQTNFDNGTLILRERKPDLYIANLDVYAGYANLDFGFTKLKGNAGIRFETDQIDVLWDVANYVGRIGALSNTYNNLLPSLNLKYELSEKSAFRFAASKTLTLPEFKELAPFEYVSPTGRITKGSPNLQESTVYNLDIKWELFPSPSELISVSGFFKNIKDPINKAQTRGSSGIFTFDNTGEKATVYGVEFEGRWGLLKSEDKNSDEINFIVNATKMWFNQDLLNEFQYNGKTSSDLEGASDFILNSSFNYTNNKENEFGATLTGNYSSDKIFALGAPEDFANSDVLYNDEIIEKGFITLDLVLRKKLNEHFSMSFKGLNLLNPQIEQTQKVKDIPTQVETNETVVSYKKGIDLQVGLRYSF